MKILKADLSNWKSMQFARFYATELIMMIPHDDKELADLMELPDITEHAIVHVSTTLHFGIGPDAMNFKESLFPFTTYNN